MYSAVRMMSNRIVVIGGGAAGMMAAITAAENGAQVTLLERNDRLGKKLYITGKGRCNVTNDCAPEDFFQNVPRNPRFLYSAIYAFPPREVMAWFEARGCALKTERGNRVFPQSDKSASVIDALRAELRRLGVRVLQERALDIVTQDGAVCGIETDGGFHKTERVILATGGCSYPQTGSTGDGYRMLEKPGHTIVPPVGSLVPLVENGYVNDGNPVTKLIIAEYLQEVKDAGVDTLILGCTHYPLLKKMIGDFMGSDVTLIDSGKVTAQAAAAALADLGLLNGRAEGGNAHYYVSDTPDNFDELEHRFLGEYAGGPVEQIAIETY